MLALALPPVLAASDIAVAIPIVAIVFGCLVAIVKTIANAVNKRHEMNLKLRGVNLNAPPPIPTASGPLTGSDADSVRRMQAAVDRLEQRIEALETILIERSRAPR